MKEVLPLLAQLQQTDTDLTTLNKKLAELPERIAKLQQAADHAKAELESTRQAIIEHRKKYKLAEVELRSTEEKANTYSVQLYAAKTNEQYKAFLKEIEAQKRLASQIEDQMIAIMEELEQLEKKVAEQEKNVAATETDAREKIRGLQAEARELEDAITVRQKRRAEAVAALPPEMLKRYERIRASKNGIAVAPIKADRCNGCLSPIPPQRILEISACDRIFTCETCGRILLPPQ